jgi:hypothetical protein
MECVRGRVRAATVSGICGTREWNADTTATRSTYTMKPKVILLFGTMQEIMSMLKTLEDNEQARKGA